MQSRSALVLARSKGSSLETWLQFQSQADLEAHPFHVVWQHHNPMPSSQGNAEAVPEVDASLELERAPC